MNARCTIGVLRSWVQLFRPSGKPTLLLLLVCLPSLAQAAAATAPVPPPAPLPEIGFSVLRLLGALVFVIALFLTAIWGVKRWQHNTAVRRGGARLVVLDVQALGGRQSIYVVGYERQRMLIGTSAAGVSLIAHLPDGDTEEVAGPSGPASFAAAFQQVLGRKAS